jgi:lipopolysaccharide transport system ATP-binding protein
VGTGFHPELTGRENVFLNGAILGMRKEEVQKKFDEIVDFSGVEKFIDTPVKRYSSGMYVRLAFAVAAHLDPEILVVDEVLAVGDAEFQKKCLGKMGDVAGEGRTVLFVSHNMAAARLKANETIENFRINLTIYQRDGRPVGAFFGPQTLKMGQNSKKSFRIALPTLQLAPGKYNFGVSVGLGSYIDQLIDFDILLDVLDFEIKLSNNENNAFLRWSSSWGTIRFDSPEISEFIE